MLVRLLVLISALLCSPAHAWTHGAGTVGQGGGVSLAQGNLFSPLYAAPVSQRTLFQPAASTADYYHTDGIYWAMPYDLNAMGTWGQNIATTKGYRYVWLITADHPTSLGNYPTISAYSKDGSYVYVAYSNDPAIAPDPSTMSPIIPAGTTGATIPGLGGTGLMYSFMVPWLVYDADDSVNHAKIFTQCIDASGGALNTAHEECLWKGNDFDHAFTAVGITHAATTASGFTAFQSVYRTGVNIWESYGGGNTAANDGSTGRWTASAAAGPWTLSSVLTSTQTCRSGMGTCGYPVYATQRFSVSGQVYVITAEDARTVGQGGPGGDGGEFVSLVAIDANGNILSSPAVTRISAKYIGNFPGPTFLQSVSAYVENGVGYAYALHGFFPSCCGVTTNGATYAAGGGLQEEYLDLYIYVVDSSAALTAAPAGVRASASGGIVSLTWYDVLPVHTYNVYRCTAGGSACSSSTLLGTVTGASTTDTPTASSSCAQQYYKVVTNNGGTEEGSRIVGTIVTSGSTFVNKHLTRACAAGADYTTMDQTWLASVDTWLNNNALQTSCLAWTNAAFGIVRSSGSAINQIMDLCTTRLPRGGDYTPQTPANTTYGATSCNSAVPGWTNVDTSSPGYYGGSIALGSALAPQRLNQIRRKNGFSFLAAYQTSNNSTNTTLLAFGQNNDGMSLQHIPGSPGQGRWNVAQLVSPPTWTLTDNKNLTGATAHVIGGSYDGTTATVYVEGSAGSGQSPAVDNSPQLGQVGDMTDIYVLNSGSRATKVATANDTTKTYSFFSSESQYVGCDLAVFDTALTPAQQSSWSTLIRGRIGAFLLKRDFDPANDNYPMWLEDVA